MNNFGKILRNILKNFVVIFVSVLFFFFGFNYLFQKEELISLKKREIESVDQIIANTKYYYILKFKNDTIFYSVEFSKNRYNAFDINKQKNNSINSTNSTVSSNYPVGMNFNKGDSVIIEYTIKKYPLFLDSTKNFKIKGFNARIYLNSNF